MNFSFDYVPSLQSAVTDVFNLDPAATDYFDLWVSAKYRALAVLNNIDTNDDASLSAEEIIKAVQDVYGTVDNDQFVWSDAKEVALALDVMNNMPHLETNEFLV